jgi:outer membrane protein assembly factor BamB
MKLGILWKNLLWLRLVTAFVLAARVVTCQLCAAEPWWPQFHGPNGDNISADTGLLKQWPADGPKLAWQFSEAGRGYSGVSIAKGRVFMSGDFGNESWVLALDMNGKLLWKTQNGASWQGPYPGSRTTPTFDNGIVYQMNAHGRLVALEAATGKEVWVVDLKERFDAAHGKWGLTENVAIEGDRLFCTPGGEKALVAALDKRTGKTLWTNTDLKQTAAYCSPILVTHGGVRQLITMTQKSVVGVETATGKLLWSHPHETRSDQNVNAPIYHNGYICTASGHFGGARLVKISADNRSATEVWWKKDLDCCHGGVVRIGDCLYGSACRGGGRGFFCADFMTGDTRFRDLKMSKLSLTLADGLLYAVRNNGTMLLLSPRADGFDVVSQFDVRKTGGTDEFWAHPVVCGGRLYLRHGSNLFAYQVREESSVSQE